MAREYRLMSSDGHLEVPPERWVHRVPQRYRDRAPRTIHLPDGGDALLIEGQPLLEANFLDLRAGRPAGQWQPFGIKVEDAAGTGSAEQRLQEQDRDGLDAEVLFPAMVAGPVFWRNISHDEVYKAVIRAYNEWLAADYCAVAPDRLIGMGVMPITNVDDAVAEMEHWASITAPAALCPLRLSHESPRWTERGRRYLDRVQYRGKHGARLLPEKSLRSSRPVRTREQEVMNGCKTYPFPGMVKAS
jgi:hypothetical protein